MNMQLVVASRHDPVEDAAEPGETAARSTSIVLNGDLDDVAVQLVTETIARQFEADCESVVVAFEDVTGGDEALEALVANVMRLRAEGRQVQLSARDPALHDRCDALPHSRDFLIGFEGDPDGVRRALHLDGPLAEG